MHHILYKILYYTYRIIYLFTERHIVKYNMGNIFGIFHILRLIFRAY